MNYTNLDQNHQPFHRPILEVGGHVTDWLSCSLYTITNLLHPLKRKIVVDNRVGEGSEGGVDVGSVGVIAKNSLAIAYLWHAPTEKQVGECLVQLGAESNAHSSLRTALPEGQR